MKARARMAGHAIHPMLITFPLGLLATAVVFDVVYLITDKSSFSLAAAYAIGAGIIGGVVASLTGWIDWTKIPPGTRARRVGTLHGAGNVIVLLLFAASWLVRSRAENWDPSALALVLGFAGALIAGGTGWLGGELVERLGIGVDEGAHPDAPSSLSKEEPAGPVTGSPHARPAR